MKRSEQAHAAADYILRNGWWRGGRNGIGPAGQVCLGQALRQVWDYADEYPHGALEGPLWDLLNERLGMLPIMWNDYVARRAEVVIAMLHSVGFELAEREAADAALAEVTIPDTVAEIVPVGVESRAG